MQADANGKPSAEHMQLTGHGVVVGWSGGIWARGDELPFYSKRRLGA